MVDMLIIVREIIIEVTITKQMRCNVHSREKVAVTFQ